MGQRTISRQEKRWRIESSCGFHTFCGAVAVGGDDFDRNYVDYILGKHAGKPVNVLIDSLGGSVATPLSIVSAFRNHSDVSVHFRGEAVRKRLPTIQKCYNLKA